VVGCVLCAACYFRMRVIVGMYVDYDSLLYMLRLLFLMCNYEFWSFRRMAIWLDLGLGIP
jgi:hypothetical protein